MRLRRTGFWACLLFLAATGCSTGPTFLKPEQQRVIDRSVVDYPPGFELREVASGLSCPSGMQFDQDGTLFIAEGATANSEPHIFGRRQDGSTIQIYPVGRRVPFIDAGFKIYGPIGGIAVAGGKIFVSHRDVNGMGVITAFGYDGSHRTVVSGFPTQGDYAMTDIAIRSDGRLFFGVGSATNSGVVGLDNWQEGWLRRHPDICDKSYFDLKLHGAKFTSRNPIAGLFGGGDTAVTGPYQPFNTNDQIRIKHTQRANSAIYSISPTGGDLELWASGIRLPRGLGFAYGYALHATNDGMELRGSRPIKDDPDSLLEINKGAVYGFPDFSTDLLPISDERFQPPQWLAILHGYPETNLLVDRASSDLPEQGNPRDRDRLLKGVFPPLAGASKFDFLPSSPAYRAFRGANAVVALSGDRAPFATSGLPLNAPVGYKVAIVAVDDKKVSDFIYNTRGLPAHLLGRNVLALERPDDVKMGPDNSVYILDMGRVRIKNGKEVPTENSGRLFKLSPIVEAQRPTTRP